MSRAPVTPSIGDRGRIDGSTFGRGGRDRGGGAGLTTGRGRSVAIGPEPAVVAAVGLRPGFLLAVAASAVVGLGVAIGSPGLVVVTPAVAAWAGHATTWAHRRRRAEARRAATVAGVEALIQHLRTGGSLGPAVRSGLGPHWSSGSTADLRPDERLVSASLRILIERGGPALSSLERLSDTLRSADALREEARVQAAQATTSATALAVLPMVFATVLLAVDARLREFYLRRPLGAICLLAAVSLGHGSWWLMQRLIGDDP